MIIQFNNKEMGIDKLETFAASSIRASKINYFHPYRDTPLTPDNGDYWFRDQYARWKKVLDTFVNPNKAALDIGACYGDTSVIIASHCSQVAAFEPGRKGIPICKMNFIANPDLNIKFYEYGINDKEGEFDAYYDSEGYNGGIVTDKIKIGQWKYTQKLKVITLDQHFEKDPELKPLVGFIKIDTESSDCRILNSFRDYIKDNKIVVSLEWWPQTHDEIQNLIDYLDYDIYHGGTLQKLNNIVALNNWYQDIIICPK